MTNVLIVTLPWPAAELSPNAPGKKKWRKVEAVTAARNMGYLAAFDAGAELHCGEPLSVVLEFWPPDKRHYDLDNLISRCKAYLDGMFIAARSDDHAVIQLAAVRHTLIARGGVKITIRRVDPEALAVMRGVD